MNDTKIKIDELLMQGNPVHFSPQGYSMYPVIVPGRDSVVVYPVEGRKLKRGDVALYRRYGALVSKGDPETGMLVIHRVWRHKKDGIYMVGDNEKNVEGPLQESQFVGIMEELHRKGRVISRKNLLYRFLTGLWLFLRPLRPGISGLAAAIKKPIKKILKK